ncbi:hypothetical protein [Streptococcus halotolerans]|uniref:hypothetical protein n=1 Tax=Streptococcus halotolerans TaxID=1814128 RepID=UPI0007881DC8|nr:hypothetical protein [Streptococcus halotolerans]
MAESLIKSKQRVQQHGEVFTPSWMVQKMLDTPGVKEACDDIYATFLEPAAGDGNFLLAILERKLSAVIEQYDKKYWKAKSLIALTSIYGIEFLEDNLELARAKMFLKYLDWFEKHLGIHLSSKDDVYQSANYLIHKNIIRGNTLTKKHPMTGAPLKFSEWHFKNKQTTVVEKIDFFFADLFDEAVNQEDYIVEGQLSLFDLDGDGTDDLTVEMEKEVTSIAIQKVYKLGD